MASPAPKICPPCAYQGPARRCPLCGGPTIVIRELQEIGSSAQSARGARRGHHSCPRCSTDVPCVRRGDLSLPEAAPASRICPGCGWSGKTPGKTCPICRGATVSIAAVAQAEKAASGETFPLFDETLALQLEHRCPACEFLLGCAEEKGDRS